MDFILVALLVLTGFWMFNNVSKKKEIVETKENRENNIIEYKPPARPVGLKKVRNE